MAENGNVLENLSAKQHMLIAELVAGKTIQEAAKAAGVAERTAHRWLNLPEFQEAYRTAKVSMFEDALDKLKQYLPRALDKLNVHIDASTKPTAATQVRAAQLVLEQAIEIYKLNIVEEKLAELEKLLKPERKVS